MITNSPKVLMIHEVYPEFLDLDLSKFDIITFDDGLYSQFLHYKHFLKFNKPLIFFISSNIIRPLNVKPNNQIIRCAEAHEKAFKGNFENYMSIDEIKEISKYAEIGCHGHNHILFKNSIKDFKNFKEDTLKSLEFFKNLEINIKSFCFPYNQDHYNFLYKSYIKSLELEMYGHERFSIENLIYI